MFLHKHLMKPATALLVVVVGAALFALPATSSSTASPGVISEHPVSRGEPSFPNSLLFVKNVGQWPDAARFQVWGSPASIGTTWLAEDAIWITMVAGPLSSPLHPSPLSSKERGEGPGERGEVGGLNLKLSFPGSNPHVQIQPLNPLTTTVSYFLGDDPDQWHAAVPVYGGLRYVDLYPGVDLVLGGRDAFWRLEAEPGAETASVRVQVEGAEILDVSGATMRLVAQVQPISIALPQAHFAYRAVSVSSQGEALTMNVHPIDMPQQASAPADNPEDLIYSTFLGGNNWDRGTALALDAAGRATVTGGTTSNDFPTTPGVFDPNLSGFWDAFVLRLNATGSALVYATFLGGSYDEECHALALDAVGRATVTGDTESSDFPTTPGAFDPSFNGDVDAFVARLNATGTALDYATFLGGSRWETGDALALDTSGRASVTGWTQSSNFPTTPGAFDTSYNGSYGDAYVVGLNAAGSALDYATFLGGSSYDYGTALALDVAGRATVTGWTESSDFPITPGAFDTSFNGWPDDAFVVRLNAAGNALDYATFLGGSEGDRSYGLALDTTGRASVTGETRSSDFPTTLGVFDSTFGGGTCGPPDDPYPCLDAFAARLNANGSALDYATFLGGSSEEGGNALALDAGGGATVTGWTQSSDFPTTPGAFDTSPIDWPYSPDAFVVRLTADGSALVYGTFLGKSGWDEGYALALDAAGRVIATGKTSSSDFPTTPGAFDTSYSPFSDAFVSKLNVSPLQDVVAPIEQPTAGAFITGTVTLSGFAIDLTSASGTGIDRIHIYLDGPYGTGTIIGGATYGLDRPDVAAQYGARFGPSGWELTWDTSAVPHGVHELYLYAHRSADNAWSLMAPHLVVVRADHVYWLPFGTKNQ